MEVESFEDEGVAKLLNDWFVSIKVSNLLASQDLRSVVREFNFLFLIF